MSEMTLKKAWAIVDIERDFPAEKGTERYRMAQLYIAAHADGMAASQQERANEYAHAARLVEWINDPQRKPAVTAFTEGPERQVAYAVEEMISNLSENVADRSGRNASLHMKNLELEREVAELKSLLGAERDAFGKRETELLAELAPLKQKTEERQS